MKRYGWLANVALATIVRRLTYLALAAVLAYFSVGKAQAQDCYPGLNTAQNNAAIGTPTANMQEALAKCNAMQSPAINGGGGGWFDYYTKSECTVAPSGKDVQFYWRHQSVWQNCSTTYSGREPAKDVGPVLGWGWQPAPQLECPNGAQEDAFNPGTCLTDETCRARSAGLGIEPVTKGFESACKGGCLLKADSGSGTTCANGICLTTGTYTYTGTCPVNAPNGPDKPTNEAPSVQDPPADVCQPAGSLTLCHKPDGKKCVTASTGREICWSPGETGEKTDGPVVQKKCNGTVCPDLPDKPPPPGDNFTKGPSVTETTTKGGTSTTSTVNNFNTITGGPAGSSNQGQPGSTTGTNSGTPPGDGDGEDGTASGGGDCKTPPITTGDPVLGMVATQAWSTRCAVEAGNAAKVTGDVGDCDSPFTVEGTNANAEQLRAMRAQICPKEGAGGDGTTDQSGLGGEDDGQGNGFVKEGEEFGADGLDDEGLGFSRACPTMPAVSVFGTSVKFDNSVMCDWLELGGLFVMVLAALASLKIMAGGT
jgi:hypothetical protein